MFETIVRRRFLQRLDNIQYGKLLFTSPEGKQHHIQGSLPGPSAELVLKDWRVIVNLSLKGDIGFAEDYRDGYISTPNLQSLILFCLKNQTCFQAYLTGSFVYNLVAKLGYLTKRNRVTQSKKNIQAHYDLGNDFYRLWLDPSMTYSSALYRSDTDSLEAAQHNKYYNILRRLKKQGTILEIGCGWGGFIEQAMQHGNYTIKGITLSSAQQQYCRQRLAAYADKVTIALEDYRHQDGTYDAIVSIEMLEAVGQEYWQCYFDSIAKQLHPEGTAIIQTIIIDDALFETYAKGTDMIRTHIFPGGMLPCLSRLKKHIQAAQLRLVDVNYFGHDYAKTLDEWLFRFNAQQAALLTLGFDERFQRLWACYLATCSAAFEHQRINVIQLEIRHAR